jgi:hypothetical protein
LVILLICLPVYGAVEFVGGANLLWDDTAIIDTSKNQHSISVTIIPYDVDYSPSTTWGQVILFTGRNGLMSLSFGDTGIPRFRWYIGSTWYEVAASGAWTDGVPVTLVGVWQRNAACYLYVNGTQYAGSSIDGALAGGGGVYYNSLGGYGFGTSYSQNDYTFRGTISEACVWNDNAVSAQDAINLSSKVTASCRDIDSSKLSAYWPLDEYPDGTSVIGQYYASQDPSHAGSTSANLYGSGATSITAKAEPQMTHK